MSKSTDTIIEDGARVRVVGRTLSGDDSIDLGHGREGREYTLFAFSPAGEGDDPTGKAYYLLDDVGCIGGSHWAYPENVEVVRTADEMRNRKVPTAQEIADAVASEVIGMDRVVMVDETNREGDGQFYAAGVTEDGLEVSFVVTVSEVEGGGSW